jgi:hypothetical protein
MAGMWCLHRHERFVPVVETSHLWKCYRQRHDGAASIARTIMFCSHCLVCWLLSPTKQHIREPPVSCNISWYQSTIQGSKIGKACSEKSSTKGTVTPDHCPHVALCAMPDRPSDRRVTCVLMPGQLASCSKRTRRAASTKGEWASQRTGVALPLTRCE